MVLSHSQWKSLVARVLVGGIGVVIAGASLNVQAEHEGKIQILLLGDSTTEGSVPRRLKPSGQQFPASREVP